LRARWSIPVSITPTLYSTVHLQASIAKLQRVQNALARVVTYKKRTDHIRSVLENLHWLPINYRIDYKVASLAVNRQPSLSPSVGQRLHTYQIASVIKAASLTEAISENLNCMQDVRSAKLLQLSGTICRSTHVLLRHTHDSDLR